MGLLSSLPRKFLGRLLPPPRPSIVVGRTAPYLPFLSDVRLIEPHVNHALIVGQTRSGKSRLLQSRFLQGIAQGDAVGILEPHFDLSLDTLSALIAQGFFKREEGYEQLLYLDWNNGSYTPLNILHCDPERYRSGDMEEVATVVENALDAFLRIWPELEQAPMFAEMFTAAVHTLVVNRLPITSLYALLVNPHFRTECLRQVHDPLIRDTFAAFSALKPVDQLNQSASLRRRALLLAYHPATRLTLSQPECLDLRALMDQGISFICNLGSLRSRLVKRILGAMLLVQIEQAALSRIDLLPHKRRRFTVLLDEWPAFAAQDKSIADILSQAAKYGLSLWLACQSLSQIAENRLVGAMENCRLTMIFGVGTLSAKVEAEHLATIDPFRVKEGPLTDTQHAQYLSIVEQFAEMAQALRNQDQRHFHYKLGNEPTKRLRTLPVPDVHVEPAALREVLNTFRTRYQRTPGQVASVLDRLPIGSLDPRDEARQDLAAIEAEGVEDDVGYAAEQFL